MIIQPPAAIDNLGLWEAILVTGNISFCIKVTHMGALNLGPNSMHRGTEKHTWLLHVVHLRKKGARHRQNFNACDYILTTPNNPSNARASPPPNQINKQAKWGVEALVLRYEETMPYIDTEYRE